MKLTLLTLACTLGVASAVSADLVVTASVEPPEVRLREAATLTVSVQGSQSSKRPAIADIPGLEIQYLGPSTQVSIIDGRISASVSHRLMVSGKKPGRYEISPIRVEAEGKIYDAGPVVVTVLPPGSSPRAASDDAAGALHLSLSTPRSEVFLHEKLPLTVTLRIAGVRVDDLQYPEIPSEGVATGKLSEPVQRREQGPAGLEHVIEFRAMITPVKQGEITVGPATMRMRKAVPGRRRSPFAGGFFGDNLEPVEIASAPLSLTVLPLPAQGRPADFSGAVGEFSLHSEVEPREVAAGDPVTVTTTIRGEGSLDGIAPPAIPERDGLRVYPVQTAAEGEDGSRSFEQVVIPTRAGTVTIAGPRFDYFDPRAREYRTLESTPVAVRVTPSAAAKAAPQIVGGASVITPVEVPLGRDLVFIKEAPGRLSPIGERLHRNPLFWLAQVVPVLLFLAAAVYDRRRRLLHGDSRLARFARAGKRARAELARARGLVDGGRLAEAQDATAAALRDYLESKLDLPPGAVAEAAPLKLRAAGVSNAVVAELVGLFGAFESARFAPGSSSTAQLRETLAAAERLIKTVEATRRLRPSRRTATTALLLALSLAAAHAAEGPLASFFRGNALYGDERYTDAIAAYQRVIDSGLESGPLQFNLGNAYFKSGDVGHAVLHYERSLRLMPGDPDLAANLAFARESSGDSPPGAGWRRLVFPLAWRSSADRLLLAAAACWWVTLLAVAAGRLAPAFSPVTRRMAAAGVLALAVAASSCLFRVLSLDGVAAAVVTASAERVVRYEPSPSGTAFFVAKPGTVLEIESTRPGWSRVRARDGRRGWIESDAISPI